MANGSLIKKLRLQAGDQALILNAPPGYIDSLGEPPAGVQISEDGQGPFDFVHIFVTNSQELERLWPMATAAVKYDSLFWISYPKRSAKVESDLSRDVIWKWTTGTGLRPVTQISIDEVWSALRFRPAEKVGN